MARKLPKERGSEGGFPVSARIVFKDRERFVEAPISFFKVIQHAGALVRHMIDDNPPIVLMCGRSTITSANDFEELMKRTQEGDVVDIDVIIDKYNRKGRDVASALEEETVQLSYDDDEDATLPSIMGQRHVPVSLPDGDSFSRPVMLNEPFVEAGHFLRSTPKPTVQATTLDTIAASQSAEKKVSEPNDVPKDPQPPAETDLPDETVTRAHSEPSLADALSNDAVRAVLVAMVQSPSMRPVLASVLDLALDQLIKNADAIIIELAKALKEKPALDDTFPSFAASALQQLHSLVGIVAKTNVDGRAGGVSEGEKTVKDNESREEDKRVDDVPLERGKTVSKRDQSNTENRPNDHTAEFDLDTRRERHVPGMKPHRGAMQRQGQMERGTFDDETGGSFAVAETKHHRDQPYTHTATWESVDKQERRTTSRLDDTRTGARGMSLDSRIQGRVASPSYADKPASTYQRADGLYSAPTTSSLTHARTGAQGMSLADGNQGRVASSTYADNYPSIYQRTDGMQSAPMTSRLDDTRTGALGMSLADGSQGRVARSTYADEAAKIVPWAVGKRYSSVPPAARLDRSSESQSSKASAEDQPGDLTESMRYKSSSMQASVSQPAPLARKTFRTTRPSAPPPIPANIHAGRQERIHETNAPSTRQHASRMGADAPPLDVLGEITESEAELSKESPTVVSVSERNQRVTVRWKIRNVSRHVWPKELQLIQTSGSLEGLPKHFHYDRDIMPGEEILIEFDVAFPIFYRETKMRASFNLFDENSSRIIDQEKPFFLNVHLEESPHYQFLRSAAPIASTLSSTNEPDDERLNTVCTQLANEFDMDYAVVRDVVSQVTPFSLEACRERILNMIAT